MVKLRERQLEVYCTYSKYVLKYLRISLEWSTAFDHLVRIHVDQWHNKSYRLLPVLSNYRIIGSTYDMPSDRSARMVCWVEKIKLMDGSSPLGSTASTCRWTLKQHMYTLKRLICRGHPPTYYCATNLSSSAAWASPKLRAAPHHATTSVTGHDPARGIPIDQTP